MAFKRLEEFDRQRKATEAARVEDEARKALRRVVKDALPAGVKAGLPKRPKGRSAIGGLSRKEVRRLRALAEAYMDGPTGLKLLEADVKRTVITILLIDGLMGTEPWRAAGGPHGPLVSANARLRYLENAARVLEDMRRGQEAGSGVKLLEGVLDAEKVDAGG
jgi:hypothetical protein